jgi:hypothetical protein
MTTSSDAAGQLFNLRELVRDAVEVARSGAASAADPAEKAAFERAGAALATALVDLDDVATRRKGEAR